MYVTGFQVKTKADVKIALYAPRMRENCCFFPSLSFDLGEGIIKALNVENMGIGT